MRFKPLSEEELKARDLLPRGWYDFEVIEAKDDESSKGNPMIVLDLRVANSSGNTGRVRDYILAAFPKKLNHFCRGVGVPHLYDSGELTARDCMGKSGRCEVEHETWEGELRAKVKDYDKTPPGADAARVRQDEKVAAAKAEVADDDIPF